MIVTWQSRFCSILFICSTSLLNIRCCIRSWGINFEQDWVSALWNLQSVEKREVMPIITQVEIQGQAEISMKKKTGSYEVLQRSLVSSGRWLRSTFLGGSAIWIEIWQMSKSKRWRRTVFFGPLRGSKQAGKKRDSKPEWFQQYNEGGG